MLLFGLIFIVVYVIGALGMARHLFAVDAIRYRDEANEYVKRVESKKYHIDTCPRHISELARTLKQEIRQAQIEAKGGLESDEDDNFYSFNSFMMGDIAYGYRYYDNYLCRCTDKPKKPEIDFLVAAFWFVSLAVMGVSKSYHVLTRGGIKVHDPIEVYENTLYLQRSLEED